MVNAPSGMMSLWFSFVFVVQDLLSVLLPTVLLPQVRSLAEQQHILQHMLHHKMKSYDNLQKKDAQLVQRDGTMLRVIEYLSKTLKVIENGVVR